MVHVACELQHGLDRILGKESKNPK
jgi:hypothetical protein